MLTTGNRHSISHANYWQCRRRARRLWMVHCFAVGWCIVWWSNVLSQCGCHHLIAMSYTQMVCTYISYSYAHTYDIHILIYIQLYTHTYAHTYMNTTSYTYTHTYVHTTTYTHAYTHTTSYIHGSAYACTQASCFAHSKHCGPHSDANGLGCQDGTGWPMEARSSFCVSSISSQKLNRKLGMRRYQDKLDKPTLWAGETSF